MTRWMYVLMNYSPRANFWQQIFKNSFWSNKAENSHSKECYQMSFHLPNLRWRLPRVTWFICRLEIAFHFEISYSFLFLFVFFNFFFLFLILITDAVPEAIYKELPPRLQKEVQVDRTRAPSLSANWAEENIIETAARKWNKNKAKFVRKKKIIKRKKSTSYSSQIPPREQWNKAIWRGNLLLERVYVCRDILIVVFSRLA